MNDQELLRIFHGSVLRIEFSPKAKTAGLQALEIAVVNHRNQDKRFVAVAWLRPFFKRQCEIVFDREKNDWTMCVRVGKVLREIPIENVKILEEGISSNNNSINISL